MSRPPLPKDLRLVNKVSRYYYEQDLSVDDIAARLTLSRASISRLLKFARQIGMVQVTVTSPPGIYTDLEQALEARFGLQEAVVVEVEDNLPPRSIARVLGTAAARHLQDTIRDGELIGVSWGSTLTAMAAALPPLRTRGNQVVQIIGGLGEPTSEVHATTICRRMAASLGCELTLLPAPGIMGSREAVEIIKADAHIQHTMQYFDHLNVAYVGIGAPTPNAIMMQDGTIITQQEMAEQLALGAVGDIALRFFDARGAALHSELDERVIGITLEQIRAIPRVVGVAGGLEKLHAVRGALAGGLIKALITDQILARQLINGADLS